MTTKLISYVPIDHDVANRVQLLLDGEALQVAIYDNEGVREVRLTQDPKKNFPMMLKIARGDASVLKDQLFHDYMIAWVLDANEEKLVPRADEMRRLCKLFGQVYTAPQSYNDIVDYARDRLEVAGINYQYSAVDDAVVPDIDEIAGVDVSDGLVATPVVGCNLQVGLDQEARDVMFAQNFVEDRHYRSIYRAVFGSDPNDADPYDYGFCYLLLLRPELRRTFIARVMADGGTLPRTMDYICYCNYKGIWDKHDFANYVEFTLRSTGVHIRPVSDVIDTDYVRISAYLLFQALDRFFSIRADRLSVAWDSEMMQFVGLTEGVGRKLPIMSLGPKARTVCLSFGDDRRFFCAWKDMIVRASELTRIYDFIANVYKDVKDRTVVIPSLTGHYAATRTAYLELFRYLDGGTLVDVEGLSREFAGSCRLFVQAVVSSMHGRPVLTEWRGKTKLSEAWFWK